MAAGHPSYYNNAQVEADTEDFSGVPGQFVNGKKPFWENGNGLKNEKLDAYGHIAAWSTGEADFNKKAKQPWIASDNKGDKAPKSHMNGFTLGQTEDFSGVPGQFVTGQKPFWENGNGNGSEKLDAYGHIAKWSTGENDFNTKAKQPWIASANKGDSAPVSHPLGFTLS